MTITNRVGQPMLAAMFIAGGTDQLLHPEDKADVASTVVNDLEERTELDEVPLQDDPASLVRINGGVQVAAGALLAMNKVPRLAAAALAGTLVPTTLGAHRFWEYDDEATKAEQRVHFLKNMAMLGGLLVTMSSTQGRPSMSWRARRAVTRSKKDVSTAVADVTSTASRTAADVAESAGRAASEVAESAGTAVERGAHAATPTIEHASKRAKRASKRASAALADAEPVVRSTAKDVQSRARAAWSSAVPVGRSIRDSATEMADRAVHTGRQTMKSGRKSLRGSRKGLRQVIA